MILYAPIVLALVLGVFNLQVNWAGPSREAINIAFKGEGGAIRECLSSGLEVRYRFRVKLCRRRSLWPDACESERIDTHNVQYDPISQSYTLRVDTHHDNEDPREVTFDSEQGAIASAGTLKGLALHRLPGARRKALERSKAYVGVRATLECKGGNGGIIGQIPLLLSFGLINPSVTDSGWIAFDLDLGRVISP